MKKLILIMCLALAFAFCACGSEEEEPVAYSPSDIQVEDADGVNVYSVIYNITTEKEDWSGYPEDQRELDTAVNGIKECMDRDDWSDGSIVYGYAQEPLLKNMLYSYDSTDVIKFYQYGIYNTDFLVGDELK